MIEPNDTHVDIFAKLVRLTRIELAMRIANGDFVDLRPPARQYLADYWWLETHDVHFKHVTTGETRQWLEHCEGKDVTT